MMGLPRTSFLSLDSVQARGGSHHTLGRELSPGPSAPREAVEVHSE